MPDAGLASHISRIVVEHRELRHLAGDDADHTSTDAAAALLVVASKLLPDIDAERFSRLAYAIFKLSNGEGLRCAPGSGSSAA